MIFAYILGLIDAVFVNLNSHAFDLNLDTNNYVACTLAYVVKTNHFFPILDAYFPIFSLYCVVYLFMGSVKIVGIFTNLMRGAGANI